MQRFTTGGKLRVSKEGTLEEELPGAINDETEEERFFLDVRACVSVFVSVCVYVNVCASAKRN